MRTLWIVGLVWCASGCVSFRAVEATGRLDEQSARLVALEGGLTAFARAHDRLRANADALGKEDEVIYKATLKDVQALYLNAVSPR